MSGNPPLKTMDLLRLFVDLEGPLKRAIQDLKDGKSAQHVADTHLEPNRSILERNARQEMDSLYVAYALEYVVQSSGKM